MEGVQGRIVKDCRSLSRVASADTHILSVDADPCPEFVSVWPHSNETGFALVCLVCVVTASCDDSQIGLSIIQRIAVNVIGLQPVKGSAIDEVMEKDPRLCRRECSRGCVTSASKRPIELAH